MLQVFIIILAIFLTPAFSFADNPTVASFTASPSTINSGYTTVLSWTIQAGAGNDFYFFCPAGIKIFKSDGTSFPCNTRSPASSNISDTVAFNIVNVSGNTKTMQVRVYPKDLTGADYDAGAKDVYITVNTTPQPITDFNSTTTDSTGTAIKLSWTAHDVEGVNLYFDCSDQVKVFALGNTSTLPCNQPAFASDLPVSGFSSFTFTNSSFFDVPLRVSILPAITAGSYDATHALSINLNIAGKTSPPDVLIDSFTVSGTRAVSGGSLVFSWSAPQASGVNFQFVCSNLVSVMNSQGTTTANKLPCNVLAFNQSLPAVSSTTISFINNSDSVQYPSVYLLPQKSDGTYDGTKSKKIDIVVSPPNQNTNQITAPAASPKVSVTTFTQYLQRGARGKQVEALQKFLAKDSKIYPEGLITGYFGPATERAVKRFQEKYNIARQGDAGYGCAGPKTRAKLNSLQ